MIRATIFVLSIVLMFVGGTCYCVTVDEIARSNIMDPGQMMDAMDSSSTGKFWDKLMAIGGYLVFASGFLFFFFWLGMRED